MFEDRFSVSELLGIGVLGGPEIIMILGILVLLAVPVALCLGLVFYFTRKDRQARGSAKASPPPVQPPDQGTGQD